MVDCISLTTAHGDELAVLSGLLVSCRQPRPAGATPIVACRRGGILALTPNAEHGTAFTLHGRALQSAVMLLNVSVMSSGLSLIEPATRSYLTGQPLVDGVASRPVVFMSSEVNAWECFTTIGIAALSVHAGALARMSAALDLFEDGLDATRLGRFLALSGPHTASVLDAALPLLTTSTLDELAASIIGDNALRAALARNYPADLWAQVALPALVDWLPTREVAPPPPPGRLARIFGRARATPNTPQVSGRPVHRRRIGPELDSFGALGTRGEFTSLPHACNARARRLAKPRCGSAVLTTARNEGIYLIEWIAYHRLLGAEAFFVYSNDNQDGSDVLLAALADAGVITWVDSELSGYVGNAQFKAYGHALGCMPDLLAHEWVLIIDIDEFLVLDRSRFPTLQDFCSWHDQHGADTIAINWQFMAPEAVDDPRGLPLTRRNTRVLSQGQCGEGVRLVKSMSRPNRIAHSEAHVPYPDERSRLRTDDASGEPHSWRFPPEGCSASPKFADRVVTGPAVINHYLWKSAPEFMWKMARNRGDHALQKGEAPVPMLATDAHGFMRGFLAEGLKRDDRAITNMPDLEREMAKLADLPAVGNAVEEVCRYFDLRMTGLRASYNYAPDVSAWDDQARAFLRLAGCSR